MSMVHNKIYIVIQIWWSTWIGCLGTKGHESFQPLLRVCYNHKKSSSIFTDVFPLNPGVESSNKDVAKTMRAKPIYHMNSECIIHHITIPDITYQMCSVKRFT